MPSFLNDLRRISKASFNTQSNDDRSNNSSDGQLSNPSSSTLATTHPCISVPPTDQSVSAGASSPIPIRPLAPFSQNRYSIASSSPLTIPNGTPPRQQIPTSPYAPRVLSISDNSWVHQKILLIYGQISDPAQHQFDGTIWVCHHADSFPATSWPVSNAHFKALVHLQPGPNRLRLDFASPKVPTQGTPAHSSWININYLPLNQSPPLDLVILLAKDSPCTYDATPERKQREGNGLNMAIKKFKMMAYLWQAFTGEQMNRHSFGRRCFRFEEEWQQGTLTARDAETVVMRNEVKIHVVRSEKTTAEIRDTEVSQQNPKASRAGDLFTFAGDAVRDYFKIVPGQTRYVSVLILDTHWDNRLKLVRGHAALGGGGNGLQLAICGSHALQSYPSCLEEVVPAFSDCTRTDTNFVANDCNESGSSWEAANIGIGAHMHEVGHLFGCPHQESGVMLRDYVTLNRTFTMREPSSTRTGKPGQRLVLQKDECAWHRLDCLRFRFHPCFRLPSDVLLSQDESVQVWSIESKLLISAPSGIAFIEIYAEGDDVCKAWIDYTDDFTVKGPLAQITLGENELRAKLPSQKQDTKTLKVEIFSCGQGKYSIADFGKFVSKSSRIKLSNGAVAYRSGKLGFSQMEGSRPEDLFLDCAVDQRKLLTLIRVFAGYAFDGIEFIYEDSTSQFFGRRGGSAQDFPLDTRRGETLLGLHLRAGLWIDGIQILTSLGRRSQVYGNANGGSGHTLIPPRGYRVAGISGSCAQWVDGFQLLVTR